MTDPIPADDLVSLLGRWAVGRGPLYLLLAGRLRALVEEGAIPPGCPLPAERTLAARLSVGRGTVVGAYERLREEGRVTRRQGSGTRVAPGPSPALPSPGRAAHSSRFLALFDPAPGTLALTCAAPDSPPPELRASYGRAVARLATLSDDIGYHPAGHPELRAAVAARFTRRGLPTTADQVLITNGAQQALALAVRCNVAAGDTVLAERPSYPGALALFGEAAASVRTAPVGPEGLDAAALLPAMAELRPALTYLIPSFHNPTGTLISPLHRRRIAAAAGESGLLVVEDETTVDLGFHGDAPAPLASFPGGGRVLTVGSLSKLAWGGLRVGWVRGHTADIDRLARVKALDDLGGDVLGQLAAADLLADPDALIGRRRAELRAHHDHLTAGLDRLLPDWCYWRAAGGQSIWVRLPHGDAASLAQVALRHGVALLPGGAMVPDGGAAEWMRLPFIAPPATLDTAVRRLRSAWDAYTGAGSPRATTAPALNAIAV
ncbi:DNA-binding transcriptional MocR family regulator [Murinocardiopsis flavida]|uniref:DNA-binding transcriptional MocR family regulator n=1 Tax=Murinocardiopsis flavida TaxID=645275 RepID=A0A2P8DHT9_9ACTN|nr:PLP-dependent aminotransferase family protein [Murinocardiopsis flavida]PSK96776.1 DNA-binding transcriptional MocR family regulator [Murinocardiopsis flavida]